jgi:hypothetical protein
MINLSLRRKRRRIRMRMNEKNNNFYFIHLYKMKKQDKHFLIFGLLAVLLITLWSASWQIQEGFKEGARPKGNPLMTNVAGKGGRPDIKTPNRANTSVSSGLRKK